MEEVKEIVITGILNLAETAAVTNDPMHVESVKDSSEASMDDEYLLYEVEMKPGKGVLFVTQNPQWRCLVSKCSATSYQMKWLGTTATFVSDERYLVVMLRFGYTQKLRNMETNSIFQMA